LAFTHSGGVRLNVLAPVPRSREMARLVGDRARMVQDAVGRPFLLENIVYLFDVDLGMSELDFILEVLDRSGCGMVLDLTNPPGMPPTRWGWAFVLLGIGGVVAALCAWFLPKESQGTPR